jgi:hypothetical protein
MTGVRHLDAVWRHRVHEYATDHLGMLLVTCALAGVGAMFAPVVGLIWLGFVAAVFVYAGIKAALERS